MRLFPFFYFFELPGKARYGFVAQLSVTPVGVSGSTSSLTIHP